MDTRFEKLKSSIMFNLSLSSKELFHSNFLSYLFNYDNNLFCKIVGIDYFKFNAIREYKNIDIEIKGANVKYIIENKIKDVIDINQIEKIEKSRKNGNYKKVYLFSLLGNNLEMLGIEYPLWQEIGYYNIISKLKTYNFNDTYLKLLKNDYCDYMEIMISLLEDEFKYCNKYSLHLKNNIIKNYKSIRLHDLYLKYGMSHFINYFNKNNVNSDVRARFMINRSKATMIFYKQVNGIEFGIETEDIDYRRYIISDEETRTLFESKGWFNKEWKSATGKNYLKYKSEEYNDNKTFWYQNNYIDRTIMNISYDELLTFIINDFNSIL